jgi:membrane protein
MLNELSSVPTNIGRFTRFVVFQAHLWPQCVKLLFKNRADQHASVLSYNTIFGIVPLAIVMLMIFQSLGTFDDLGKQIRNLFYEQTFIKNIQYPVDSNTPTGGITLSEKVDEFTNSFYTNLNKGSISIVGSIVIIWAAIALLITIESTFNKIWGVVHGRNFIQRIAYYWAFLTLGPLLIGLAIFINTKYSIASYLGKNIFSFLGPIVPFVVPFVFAWIGLFALYVLMPNAKVSYKAALWGSFVASCFFLVAKLGFSLYMVKLIPYSVVYGVLGLIPLGVLWIYITWLIVLFGLQLTFTTQYLKTIEEAEHIADEIKQEQFLAADLHVISVVNLIFKEFEKKNSPVPAEYVSAHLCLPADFTDKILAHLTAAKIILKITEPAVGFAPSTVAENMTLADIYDAFTQATFSRPDGQSPILAQLSAERREKLTQYTIRQAIGNL